MSLAGVANVPAGELLTRNRDRERCFMIPTPAQLILRRMLPPDGWSLTQQIFIAYGE